MSMCLTSGEHVDPITGDEVTDNAMLYHVQYTDLGDVDRHIFLLKSTISDAWDMQQRADGGQYRELVIVEGSTDSVYRPVMTTSGVIFYMQSDGQDSLWMAMIEDIRGPEPLLPCDTVTPHLSAVQVQLSRGGTKTFLARPGKAAMSPPGTPKKAMRAPRSPPGAPKKTIRPTGLPHAPGSQRVLSM